MNHALYSRVAAPLATHINELAVNFVESHSPVVAQDEGRGGLPAIIVAPVMLATYAIELLTAGIANTTVVSIFGAFALVDWLLDVLFMFTLGFLCNDDKGAGGCVLRAAATSPLFPNSAL